MFVSIQRFSRLLNTLEQLLLGLGGYLIVQFKVKGVQVLSISCQWLYCVSLHFDSMEHRT